MASYFLRDDPFFCSPPPVQLYIYLMAPQWCFQSSESTGTKKIGCLQSGHFLPFWPNCLFPFSSHPRCSSSILSSLLIIRYLWNGVSDCFGKNTFAQEMPFCLRSYMNMTFNITGDIPVTASIRTHRYEACMDSRRLRSHRTERWASQDDAASTELEWTRWPRWAGATWWVRTTRLPGMTASRTWGHKRDYKTGSDKKAYTKDPALTSPVGLNVDE